MTTLKREGSGGTYHPVLPAKLPSAGFPLRSLTLEVHLVSAECIEDIECHCCHPPPDRRTWWQKLLRHPYIGHRADFWPGWNYKIWEAVEV